MEFSKYELAIIQSALVCYGCATQDDEKNGVEYVGHQGFPHPIKIDEYILDISHLLTKIEEEEKEDK